MSRKLKDKLISVIVLLGLIVLIVARFWDALAAGFLMLGKIMTGEFSPPNIAAWFVVLLALVFCAAVIAAIVFLVRLIVMAIKEK